MFGNDDFMNEIEKAFFGGRPMRQGVSTGSSQVSRDQDSVVSNFNGDYDRVESSSGYFVVINIIDRLKKGDLSIDVEDDFDSEGNDGWFGGGDRVLSVSNKGKKNSYFKIRIPKKFAKKKISHTLNNGVLEVRFGK